MKKNYLIIILALVLFSLHGEAKNPAIRSTFQSTGFVVDGDMSDWSSMAVYDENTSIVTNITNDEDYIYIKFRISNYGMINRMFKGGFIIWFNEEGKSKKNFGIEFPVGDELVDEFLRHEKSMRGLQRAQIEATHSQFIDRINTKFSAGIANIRIIDNLSETTEIIPLRKNKKDITAFLKFQDLDLLIYETKIPLDLVLSDKNIYLESSKKSFVIGYEISEYVDKQMKDEARQQQSYSSVNSRYGTNHRYQSMMQRYGEFPAITTWYKKVYLSNK